MNNDTKKVLIVDDDKDVIMLLSIHLEMSGYKPVTAIDGRDALAIASQTELSLVILDLMIPEFNGWEVCRYLKQEKRTSAIPVMIVSALSDDESKEKAIRAGADDYITKPFSPTEIMRRVDQLIKRRI